MPSQKESPKLSLSQQLSQEEQTYRQQSYRQLQKKVKPRQPVFRNALNAFLVGGAITAVAQLVVWGFMAYGVGQKEAGVATVIVMIFSGALLTGLGIYDNIVRVGGAGGIIPITGFANSIVAPALEFKSEGFIYGVGARMFTVAGPVIVYGFVTSIIIGLIVFIVG